MDCDFVSIVPEFLDMSIVCVFVTQEKSCRNWTAVRIGSICSKNFLIYFPIFIIDGVVKSKNNHLRCFFGFKLTRNLGAINATKTIRKCAIVSITSVRSVWIIFWVTPGLVWCIGTIDLTLYWEMRWIEEKKLKKKKFEKILKIVIHHKINLY